MGQLSASAGDRFEKLWAFCELGDEAHAAKLAELNVQAASVSKFTPENVALAKKYGIRLCVNAWPNLSGTHAQVLSPAEAYWQAVAEGRYEPSLVGLKGKERGAALTEFHRSRGHAYGGEPRSENVGREVMPDGNACFVGAVARSNAVQRLAKIVRESSGVGAVVFDYFGYANYHRCYHPDCEHQYRQFLSAKGADDTPENEKAFFLGELVAMNNALHDAVKSVDSSVLTVAHLYPVFLPEPLYGHRLKFDRIGETCAWYQKWPDEKIRRYAEECVGNRSADWPRSCRVPFVGFTFGGWTDRKSAADVERELRDILASGARELMVHEIDAVFADPEVHAVFRKYCGRDNP